MSGSAPESSIDLTDPSTSTSSLADPGTSLPQTGTDASGSAAATTSEKPILSKGQGRIVRDEAGNVLRVELHEEEVEAESPAVDGDVDMEQLEPQLEGNIRQTWVSDLGGLKTRLSTSKDTAVVRGEANFHSYSFFSFVLFCVIFPYSLRSLVHCLEARLILVHVFSFFLYFPVLFFFYSLRSLVRIK